MKQENTRTANWEAPNGTLLPDFIIGGAMKSGTTTLHAILNAHPCVYIPPGEIHFFDIDNILQHSDFNFYDDTRDVWTTQSMEDDPAKMWQWYLSKFEGKDHLVTGEDSTTYLASPTAAERIAMQPKAIKLIFVLRQPTQRAYSQYHHMLRTGRATYSFEDTIRFDPTSILERSLYGQQLMSYYQYIPRNRIKVVLFEDLVEGGEQTIKAICDFLGIHFDDLDKGALATHTNQAVVPKDIRVQRFRNRLLREMGSRHYLNFLPNTPEIPADSVPRIVRLIDRVHRRLNPLREGKPPPMKKSTKVFLDTYFKRELSSIEALIEQEVLTKWFGVS